MPKKSKISDFEKNLQELERLVEKMEAGDLNLEESLKNFERGVTLARACQAALAEAEQKIQIYLAKEDTLKSFSLDEDN